MGDILFPRPSSYLATFERRASPEAIRAHLDEARRRQAEVANEIGWLEGLLLRRLAQIDVGAWPK